MKKTTLGVLALALLFTIGGSALAATNTTGGGQANVQRQAKKSTKQAAIQAALDAGDYNAWATAVGSKNPLTKKITADNFALYVQYKKLMKDGKYAEAQTIGQQLGIVKIAKTPKKTTTRLTAVKGEKGYKKGWTKKAKTNTNSATTK